MGPHRLFHNLSTARRWSPMQLEGARSPRNGSLTARSPSPGENLVVSSKIPPLRMPGSRLGLRTRGRRRMGCCGSLAAGYTYTQQNPEVTAKEGPPPGEPPELVLLPWGVGVPPGAGVKTCLGAGAPVSSGKLRGGKQIPQGLLAGLCRRHPLRCQCNKSLRQAFGPRRQRPIRGPRR